MKQKINITKVGSLRMMISEHCIDRYKERVMTHRRWDQPEPRSVTETKIKRELNLRNIKKVVNYGDKYKFIFTKQHTEFRFEKSNDGKFWVLVTCVRYPRLLASEEPVDLEQIRDGHIYGIRTAIQIRENKKVLFEAKELKNNEIKEIMK